MFCKTCGYSWDCETAIVCPVCGSRFVSRRVSWLSVLVIFALLLGVFFCVNMALW